VLGDKNEAEKSVRFYFDDCPQLEKAINIDQNKKYALINLHDTAVLEKLLFKR
jgi:hypothetical protein